VSAFGPQAAAVAGRHGDGLWTLPDPESTPEVIEAYREGRRAAGREGDGEIVFQALFSWAETDEEALEAARIWKGAQPPEHFTDDWHKPAEMYEHGESEVSDEEFKENAIIAADPNEHVERLRELEQLGATIVVLQNNSGAAPLRAIEVYGSEVLPALRGERVAP
jgi:coenzyme F420-dependent glucose-6-phosphate dehydrogenase